MPRPKKTERIPAPTNPCSNCGAPVASRRPSQTGKHWCNATLCQRERSKFYRLAKAPSPDAGKSTEQLVLEQQVNDLTELVIALSKPRERCETCGLDDAIPRFPHPDLTGRRCSGSAVGRKIPAAAIFSIWPSRTGGF